MALLNDSFLDVDRRRTQLEKTVADLQKVLSKWHAWNAEYEALKDDISALGSSPSGRDLERVGAEFDGIVLTPKELRNIMLDGRKRQRSASHVMNILSHRIEYVEENVRKLDKQFLVAEEKLHAVTVTMQPESRNEDDLPLTEIREDLDDEGNVIAHSTVNPADAAPPALEALRKAGIDDPPSTDEEGKGPSASSPVSVEDEQTPVTPTKSCQSDDQVDRSSASADSGDERISRPRKKSVTFAKDTKHGGPMFAPLTKSSSALPSPVKGIMKTSPERRPMTDYSEPDSPEIEALGFRSEIIVPEASPRRAASPPKVANPPVDASDAAVRTSSTRATTSPDMLGVQYPAVESPEDAVLRRQMLQYSFEDLGAVVAELNLDESPEESGASTGDDDESDEEDAFGRSKYRAIDDDYTQEMLELQKKLQGHTLENVGPPSVLDAKNDSPAPSPTPGDAGGSTPVPQPTTAPKPLADEITESSSHFQATHEVRAPSRQPSRFKASREAHPTVSPLPTASSRISSSSVTNGPLAFATRPIILQPAASTTPKPFSLPIDLTTDDTTPPRSVPEGPSGKIHADVVERAPGTMAAMAPDEYDPALMRQELAVEYHRMRNRFVHRHNGFAATEAAEEPIQEGPAVSRFRAARLMSMGISGSH